MLSKLSKAKHAQSSSPCSAPFAGSASKRQTLDVFSTFRDADPADYQSPSDDEIEAMLDENLFRGHLGTPANGVKQFTLPSDVSAAPPAKPPLQCAKDILEHPAASCASPPKTLLSSPAGAPLPGFQSTCSTVAGSSRTSPSQTGRTSRVAESGFSQHASPFAAGESSMFTLFAPPAEDAEPPRGVAQIAPKLNAQTLFAFGVSPRFPCF